MGINRNTNLLMTGKGRVVWVDFDRADVLDEVNDEALFCFKRDLINVHEMLFIDSKRKYGKPPKILRRDSYSVCSSQSGPQVISIGLPMSSLEGRRSGETIIKDFMVRLLGQFGNLQHALVFYPLTGLQNGMQRTASTASNHKAYLT
jgi:hypothetical protein